MLTLCVQVFRRKRKLYLVFEYVDHTILGMTQKTATAIVKSSQTFAKPSFQALLLGCQLLLLPSLLHLNGADGIDDGELLAALGPEVRGFESNTGFSTSHYSQGKLCIVHHLTSCL